MDTLHVLMVSASVLSGLVQLAIIPLLLRKRAFVNLALAGYLICGALGTFTGAVQAGTHDAFLWINSELYSQVASIFAAALYLAFLGAAIPSPLTRWLAWAPVRAALLLAPFATVAWLLLSPSPLFEGARGSFADFLPDAYPPGPVAMVILQALLPLVIVSSILATTAALDAWRRAPKGSLNWRRARAYFVAFVFNDVANVAGYSWSLGLHGRSMEVVVYVVTPLLVLLFVALLARALLRDQLFDFDLKLKLNLKRGTVAAVFIGAFLVAFAIAEQYLQQFGVLVGGAAVGLLLLVVRPIERAADRIADRAMPHVHDTAEYRTVKKREVYRAALEGALDDGGVSDKERAMLARLAEQLGLGPVEMHDIEREARAGPTTDRAGVA